MGQEGRKEGGIKKKKKKKKDKKRKKEKGKESQVSKKLKMEKRISPERYAERTLAEKQQPPAEEKKQLRGILLSPGARMGDFWSALMMVFICPFVHLRRPVIGPMM